MQAPRSAWFFPHMRAADITPKSFPEPTISEEIPSLLVSYSCSFCHGHHGFKHYTIQSCKERNILLPWRRRGGEHPAESAIHDFIPDPHHALAPLDFVVGNFG